MFKNYHKEKINEASKSNFNYPKFYDRLLIGLIAILCFVSIISNCSYSFFYKKNFNDTIEDIKKIDNIVYFKTQKNWYHLKHDIANKISIGDSIIKKKNTYQLILKRDNLIYFDKSFDNDMVLNISNKIIKSAGTDK